MLQRMNQPNNTNTNLSALKNPSQDQLVKTLGEMSTVLHDNNLPDDVKSSRFNEKIKDFTIYADKIVAPTITQPTIASKTKSSHQTFHSLPKSFQQPASILLTELAEFPQRVQWDDTTNELTIDGKRMVGSNLVDLVGDVLRNRKTASPPMYSDAFLQLLADVNVPEEFIRNKLRLAKFRSFKGFNNSTLAIADNVEEYEIHKPNRKLEMLKERREKSARIKKRNLQKKQVYKWQKV